MYICSLGRGYIARERLEHRNKRRALIKAALAATQEEEKKECLKRLINETRAEIFYELGWILYAAEELSDVGEAIRELAKVLARRKW